jgi:nicotinamidase-related amidase
VTALHDLAVSTRRATLLIIDVQERLTAAMPEDVRERLERNVVILCEAARRFSIPVVISEQYPKGLGKTLAEVEAAAATHPAVHRLEKVEFGVCQAPGFAAIDGALAGRDQWIVTGMETHVCVYQSARALVARGRQVHVPEDAVASRTADNRRIGLHLIERIGAVPTATETVVFDLLGAAGGDDFKALSKLIR